MCPKHNFFSLSKLHLLKHIKQYTLITENSTILLDETKWWGILYEVWLTQMKKLLSTKVVFHACIKMTRYPKYWTKFKQNHTSCQKKKSAYIDIKIIGIHTFNCTVHFQLALHNCWYWSLSVIIYAYHYFVLFHQFIRAAKLILVNVVSHDFFHYRYFENFIKCDSYTVWVLKKETEIQY